MHARVAIKRNKVRDGLAVLPPVRGPRPSRRQPLAVPRAGPVQLAVIMTTTTATSNSSNSSSSSNNNSKQQEYHHHHMQLNVTEKAEDMCPVFIKSTNNNCGRVMRTKGARAFEFLRHVLLFITVAIFVSTVMFLIIGRGLVLLRCARLSAERRGCRGGGVGWCGAGWWWRRWWWWRWWWLWWIRRSWI